MRRAIILSGFLVAVALNLACGAGTPEEEVAKTRARYSAKLNGFFAKDVPVETEPSAVSEDEGDPAEGDETDPSEEEMVAPVTRQEVLLDIIVQHDVSRALPGITVDVTMVDGQQNEKGSWRIWIDTAGLPKANQKQVTHVLEDVGYEDGFGFNVEIRRPIPPAERGDYREFASGG